MKNRMQAFFEPTTRKVMPVLYFLTILCFFLILPFLQSEWLIVDYIWEVLVFVPWWLLSLPLKLFQVDLAVGNRFGGTFAGALLIFVSFIFWAILSYLLSCTIVFLLHLIKRQLNPTKKIA